MNAIYKVIWNDAIRQYQVVNELCRSRRKACSVKAVHTETTSGSYSVVSSLKRGALIAGTTLAMLTAWGEVAQAESLDLESLRIDFAEQSAKDEQGAIPNYESTMLPSNGESVVIDTDSIQINNYANNLYGQDDGVLIRLFEYEGDWDSSNVSLVLKGEHASGNQFDVTIQNEATYTYSVEFFAAAQGTYLTSFDLKQIKLLGGGNGLYFNTSSNGDADFQGNIVGDGNITFGFSEGGQRGYLTLNGSNTYGGRTFVGYAADGQISASPTTIYFGNSNAFGDTLNLDVEEQSEVFIGGRDQNQKFVQTVHGLDGEGLISLGSQASLTLAQSGTTTGNSDATEGVIRIDNKFTSSGDAPVSDLSSGAWLKIELSGEVEGDTVRFSNNDSKYSGGISLSGASIEAYDPNRSLDLDDKTKYTPNKILTTSTLRLESGGRLLVDGAGSVNNLILNNNNGWSSESNSNSNALSFENITLGGDALFVSGNFSLEKDATINVDSFTDQGGLDDAVEGKSFFDADDGLTNVLIEVAGNVDLGEHTLNLTGAAVQGSGTDVNQMVENEDGDLVSTKVAEARWEFNKELQYESGADGGNDSFNIEYSLKEIDIVDDMTFTLQADEDSASEGQDFTALISGNGHLAVDASGKKVSIGHEGGNTYTGNTTVTEGTSVLLTKDAAFGGGSGTLSIGAGGSVELAEGVQQSGTGLSGTGALVIGTGAEYALTQNSNAKIENTISGNGTFKVDLRDIRHELTFISDNAFSGTLDLSNASLDLSENSDALSSSHIVLNNGTNFNFGKGSTVASLEVKGNADLNADSLVIGGDAVLNVSGQMSFDSGRTFDIYDVEVADNINLVDFDGATSVANKFIQAGDFDANGQQFAINVSGATPTTGNKQQVVLDYVQGSGNTRDIVAETTWLIDQGLTTVDNALKAGVQLTNINVLNGKTLTIGAGTDTTLSAQLSSESNSGSIVFSGGNITVSNEDNDYVVATVVNADTTLTLGASYSLGKTSELSVAGKLDVGNRISQKVYGWDSDATGSITLDGSLMLDQTGAATIGNTFSGSGTFAVDLDGSTNSLVFSNGTAFSGFSGELALSNLTFDVAHTTNYSTLLSGTNVQLNTGAIFNADAAGSIRTGGFEFNGGTLLIGDVTAGNETDPKLSVAGDIVISQDSTIALDGINLQGTQRTSLLPTTAWRRRSPSTRAKFPAVCLI